jgi:hypothetical protein
MSDNQEEYPKRIWLLPNTGEEGYTTWCDDPMPDGEECGAIEYIRADLVETQK